MEYAAIRIENRDGVYAPSEDSELAAGMLGRYLERHGRSGKLKVLDMGTATGVLGIFAACSGFASEVAFTDISPEAVALARRNASANCGSLPVKLSFYQSDLFSSIDEGMAFDIIVFNAPYLRSGGEPDDARWSGGAEGIEASMRFLEGSLAHLSKAGVVILVASSLGNLEKLDSFAKDLGFSLLEEEKKHYFFEDIVVKAFSFMGSANVKS